MNDFFCLQDPQMSPFLEAFSNPETAEHLTERMARMKEDPELKPILDEIDAGGPSAMMKSVTENLFFFLNVFL